MAGCVQRTVLIPASWYCSRSCFSVSTIDLRSSAPGTEAVLELVVDDVLLPRRRLAQLGEAAFPVRRRVRGHLGRRHHGANLRRRGHVEARLLQRGRVGITRQPLLGELRQHAQLAGAHLLARLLRLDHHDVHVPAQERGEALAAARERDERPLGAGGVLQRLADDVVARGHRAARLLERAGLGLGGLDEFLERLVGRVRAHREHRGLAHQLRDRLQVVQRDLRLARRERVGDPHAGDEADGVRIVLLLGDRGGGDRAVAARLVDDLHAHRQELFLLHHRGDGARRARRCRRRARCAR